MSYRVQLPACYCLNKEVDSFLLVLWVQILLTITIRATWLPIVPPYSLYCVVCGQQSRHTLPAWYGVGSGITSYTQHDPKRIQEVQRMYKEWPFFRTFLSNVQVSNICHLNFIAEVDNSAFNVNGDMDSHSGSWKLNNWWAYRGWLVSNSQALG